jgi:hypothetical protein
MMRRKTRLAQRPPPKSRVHAKLAARSSADLAAGDAVADGAAVVAVSEPRAKAEAPRRPTQRRLTRSLGILRAGRRITRTRITVRRASPRSRENRSTRRVPTRRRCFPANPVSSSARAAGRPTAKMNLRRRDVDGGAGRFGIGVTGSRKLKES